jgi:hypothetical protein
MYATEWWAFEAVALLAGLLGEVSVAAQAGLSSLVSLRWDYLPTRVMPTCSSVAQDGALTTIAYAISLSSSARLGNLVRFVFFLP